MRTGPTSLMERQARPSLLPLGRDRAEAELYPEDTTAVKVISWIGEGNSHRSTGSDPQPKVFPPCPRHQQLLGSPRYGSVAQASGLDDCV